MSRLERVKTPKLAAEPTTLILVADGTEEIEFSTVYDILVRASVPVKSVGIGLEGTNQHVTLSRGLKIIPDHPKWDSTIGSPSLLVIPGGAKGAKTICESEVARKAISRAAVEGKWVAAICAGTTAIVNAFEESQQEAEERRISKVNVTSHPSVKEEIVKKGWDYSEDRVVVDGKVITSRGPGSAMLFALTIVEYVVGKEKRKELEGPLMLADSL